LTIMEENVRENLSESSDNSSASYILSSDSVTSSDSTDEGDSNAEILSASSRQGKRKPKRRGSSAAESMRTRTKKAKDSTRNDEEME